MSLDYPPPYPYPTPEKPISPRLQAPCEVCRGTGKSYLEHDDGTLTEMECRYCKGRKNSTWLEERFKAREFRKESIKILIVFYFVALIFTNGLNAWSVGGDGPSSLFALHCLAWLAGIGGLVWWFTTPKAKPPKPPKHAPGFTDDKEKLAGAAFLGGVMLKGKWDQTHKHQ